MWAKAARAAAALPQRSAALGMAAAGAAAAAAAAQLAPSPAACEAQASFSGKEFRSFKVLEVRSMSHDSKVLKCALPSSEHVMGMTVSSLVMVKGAAGEDGKDAPAKPYTPITTDDQKGYFELLVKGYPTGLVSKYLCSLQAGDTVEVKGPFPKLPYKANMKQHIGMVAGGSGITPMLQVLKEALKNPEDETKFTLIFGNQTPEDILLRGQLLALEATSQGRLKVFFIVDKNPNNATGIAHEGFLTTGVSMGMLPPPSPETLVYVCGPPGMMKAVSGPKKFEKGKPPAQGEVDGILKDLGYSEDMVYKF